MADSTIAITAGTGTAVDTRTEATNGHHRQVVVLGDPATNAGVAPVDATAGLKVDLGADNDITGTVTANAGTNLNTSALALEAGNLASIKAKTDNIPALGQALAAASVPVVMTASQLSTLTPPAAITGFATSAKQDTLDTSVNTLLKPASTLAAVTSITNVVHVDDNAGSLTVDNAALTSLAGAINASKVDVNIASGSASGTEYTNAGTPPANPIGPTLLWNEGGTWRTVSTAKPLPVTASISTAGLATTATDTATASIDTKTPALGQALAAASVPVILPAATITTLTPPAAITGFGTAANQTTIIGHLDGVEGLLTTIDADTGTIATEVAGLLTDTELRATPVPVSGTVAVTNAGLTELAAAINVSSQVDVNIAASGATVPVSGTFWQATQPVSLASAPTTTVTATDLDIRNLVNTDVVTAELSAVDNAVLDTIAAKDFATQTTLAAMNAKMVTGTDIGDVTINNASGASAVNIQDGGNTITVDGAVTATLAAETTKVIGTVNIAAAQTLATVTTVGAVTAITNALPAGTNAIGKLAANSGVDIGDVDVTSLPALAAGTNTIGAVKSVPSDIDINGSNTNHADKYYTNAGAVTDGIVWSPAAGKRWHVLTLYINVSAAATVTLEDDLAGGDVARWKGELAANSGVILKYDKEHPFCSGEDAADLIITTTAGNVYVQAVGYEV